MSLTGDSLNPVATRDFLEVRGSLGGVGRASRAMEPEAVRYARSRAHVSDSAADFLDELVVVARATGTCVVKAERQRGRNRTPEGSGA
jgi:3-aminobutyryl-CoA ammonia-lyase